MKIVPGDDLDQMVKEEIEKDTSGKYSAYKVDRLTAFLYYLMMDHITVGQIEQAISDIGGYKECFCPNGFLVDLAENIKEKILKP